MRLPLDDVRVLAVEQFGAGPWGTLQLADLGAEVLKIEDPGSGGDVCRYVPPFQEGEDSLFFETFNRNKKSVSLDLRHPDARAVFHDLVRASDAVYSNLRGDQPERLGLTYDQLKDVNPRVVCCSLSGFGMTGPRAAEGGYDYMMQGLAGWQMLTGEPDGPPTKSGLSLVDLSGGYASAVALLAGLWRARRDGVGCDCDVSLFETALQELMYVGTFAATKAYVPPRRRNSAHPSIVPFQNFRAADGWIVIGGAKQKFWERLCEVMGEPTLATDPRFATMAARDENRDELLPILEEIFAGRTVDEWLALLVPAGIPAARVNTVPEALDDPQTVARRSVRRARAPDARDRADDAYGAARVRRRATAGARPVSRGAHGGCAVRAVRLLRRADRGAGGGRSLRQRGGEGMRDFVGYGEQPPDPKWPNGARLALNFVLNYEEGGENTPLEGDPASEAFLHEVVGAPPTVGRRNLNTESMFEYGSRAGFWRVHRIFAKHGLPLTVYAVGQALERNPAAAQAMVSAGWEVASHGWRWIDYIEMSEDEEREHLRKAIEAIERVTGITSCRLVHGADLRQHAPPRRRGGRLPLRLGLVRRRAALLGRGRRTSSTS